MSETTRRRGTRSSALALVFLLPSASLPLTSQEQGGTHEPFLRLDVASVKSLPFSQPQHPIYKSGSRGSSLLPLWICGDAKRDVCIVIPSSLLPQPFAQREARLDINSTLITLTFFGC